MHRELEASGSYRPDQDIRQGVFNRTNHMQEDDTVMSLLTQIKVFPKIVDIMGRCAGCSFSGPRPPAFLTRSRVLPSNIYNWHNFTPCTRPAPEGTRMPTLEEMQTTEPRFSWHRE